ncbi:MAG: hypothetical protein NTX45_22245 [Proteobacteria bacterium]|nr:hypothetical protein [Pseudomonadota bacterium]
MKKCLFVLIIFSEFFVTNISFAEGLADFARDFDASVMAPLNTMDAQKAACIQGDDDNCRKLGYDPNDPCRPYFASANLYTCRIDQCNKGNDNECNKIGAISPKRQQEYQQQQSGNNNFYDAINARTNQIQVWGTACNAGNQQACALLNNAYRNAEQSIGQSKSMMRSQDQLNRMRKSQDEAETRRKIIDNSYIGSDGIERHGSPE